jgi:DNA-binding CsgD family transcriptional regulator
MNFDEKKLSMEIPGLFLGWKDKNSRIIGINKTVAKMAGFASPDEAIGKYDCDLPCDLANYANQFVAMDRRVMREDKQYRMIEVYQYANGRHALLTSKAPLKDSKNTIIGTVFYSIILESYEFIKLASILSQYHRYYSSLNFGSYVIEPVNNQFSLSVRESEVLFYLLRGKTAKQIASTLKLSPRTIEDYIDHIKIKLNCHTKSALIEKAVEAGLLYFIPNNLMNKNLSQFLLD